MKVTVLPHSAEWGAKFQVQKSKLKTYLKDVPVISIEHVGSTSVPGLHAKPILDIDIIVTEENLRPARDAMTQAGYLDMGELNVPGRYAFRQPERKKEDMNCGAREIMGESGRPEMRQNTYVCVQGCKSLRNHLDIRRVLREDEELRDEYGRIKMELAKLEWNNVNEYASRKTDILLKILRKAGWTEEDLQEVIDANR